MVEIAVSCLKLLSPLRILGQWIATAFKWFRDRIGTASRLRPLDYVIVERNIVHRFKTKVTGINTHRIKIRATRDGVSHYQGRHRTRDSSVFRINTGQKYALDRIEDAYQVFTVTLSSHLKKKETEDIEMETEWTESSHAQDPRCTFMGMAKHEKLTFNVILPSGVEVREIYGYVSAQPHSHMYDEKIPLNRTGDSIFWTPKRFYPGKHYGIAWKWVEPAQPLTILSE